MARTLNIGIGSTCSIPGDLAGNLAQIADLAAQACRAGCDLLLTPELSATGYGGYPEVLALAEPAGDGPVYRALKTIAEANRQVVLAGFVEASGDKRYLAHYAVFEDGRFIVQRKHRVTPLESPLDPSVNLYYDDTEEIGHVRAGEENFTFFQIKGVTCGIVLCADLGIHTLDQVFAQQRVELMLLPTGAGGKREERVTTADLKTEAGLERYFEAMKYACFPGDGIKTCVQQRRALAAVNMCGFDGRALYHGGQGSVISPLGDLAALIPGIPNLDRQRPRFAWGQVNFDETL